jgi:hypothetical protein
MVATGPGNGNKMFEVALSEPSNASLLAGGFRTTPLGSTDSVTAASDGQ